jgi:hypothetical protein
VLDPINIVDSFDGVVHLASPALPMAYLQRPIFTLRTGSEGTRNVLEFACAKSARFILASTSEVYGDPLIHPQSEDYWGNVNPAGPRSVYDEAKRYAEHRRPPTALHAERRPASYVSSTRMVHGCAQTTGALYRALLTRRCDAHL